MAVSNLTDIPNFIGGEWQQSQATEWQDVINPATGEVLARVPLSDTAEVGQAITSLRAGRPIKGINHRGH